MNVDDVISLIKHPLINRAELARRMFPNNKNPEQSLNSKLMNIQNKRITERDCENVIEILRKEIASKLP